MAIRRRTQLGCRIQSLLPWCPGCIPEERHGCGFGIRAYALRYSVPPLRGSRDWFAPRPGLAPFATCCRPFGAGGGTGLHVQGLRPSLFGAAPSGLARLACTTSRACALRYLLSPLRGWGGHGSPRPGLAPFAIRCRPFGARAIGLHHVQGLRPSLLAVAPSGLGGGTGLHVQGLRPSLFGAALSGLVRLACTTSRACALRYLRSPLRGFRVGGQGPVAGAARHPIAPRG
jgi:hypothetical protein